MNELKNNYIYVQVIEYIQFLREKLQMYEGPYQGWTQEATKLTPWVEIFMLKECVCMCVVGILGCKKFKLFLIHV